MKIHFTLLWGKLGGGTKIIFRLANELAARGHEISITYVGAQKDISWIHLNAKIIRIPPYKFILQRISSRLKRWAGEGATFRNKFHWDVIWEIAKKTPDCDINIATHALTAYSVFLSNKGKPFYYMQHYDALTLLDDKTSEVLFSGSYFLPLRKIANSSWLKNEIYEQKGIDVSDITIIPSAVDTSVFYPRGLNGFNKNHLKKRVVCMGRPNEWKGFKDIIEAMKIVFRRRNDIELLVYAFEDNLPKDKNAPYTLLTGVSGDKLAILLSSADIVVAPSWFESSPLPVLEAMACGAAVVTTRYGTEDIANDNINSLVVPPKKPEEIAEAILKLIEDNKLRLRLINEGLNTVKNFNWDKTVDKIEKILIANK